MAQIAVAATAAFGGDVLERLAHAHDVTALLSRPDAPRGRGRKLAPTPAKRITAASIPFANFISRPSPNPTTQIGF